MVAQSLERGRVTWPQGQWASPLSSDISPETWRMSGSWLDKGQREQPPRVGRKSGEHEGLNKSIMGT